MEELINNSFDETGGRSRWKVTPCGRLINDLGTSIQNDGTGKYEFTIHLTPTKQKRHDNSGKSANALQGRYFLCRFKTTWCCSKYEDDVCLEKLIFNVIQSQRECAL